jgi:hypothetical protein
LEDNSSRKQQFRVSDFFYVQSRNTIIDTPINARKKKLFFQLENYP